MYYYVAYVLVFLCRFNVNKGTTWTVSRMSVVVGAHDLRTINETSPRRHNIQRLVMHEKYYEQKPRYDIMLVQLSTSIAFNDETRPICVDASVFPPRTKCIVTGWGSTTAAGLTLSLISTSPQKARSD